MPGKTKSLLTLTHKQQLDLVPKGAFRVRVKDKNGKEPWRDIDFSGDNPVLETDTIMFTKDGEPVVMWNKPGRPKRNRQAVAVSPTAVALQQDKSRHFKNDNLLRLLTRNPESPDVLHEVMVEMAKEASSLEFERVEAERKNTDTRQLSVNRVQTLKAVGDTWIKRLDQISIKGVDMESDAFKVLLKFLVQTFRESMLATGMRREQVDVVVTSLASRLDSDEWEMEATAKMKNHKPDKNED